MILEQAVLNIRRGKSQEFESAFGEAKSIIASSPGFLSLELHRCVEDEHRYLLLVGWRTLGDHTQGFRGSPQYEEWRSLLHHFYEPFPTVEHYQFVLSQDPPEA